MSGSITGADLSDLEALAAAYSSAGATVAAQAAALETRVSAAVSEFVASIAELQHDSNQATESMDEDIDIVASFAAGVAWTGRNRIAFDTDLAAFTAAVHRGNEAVRAGVTGLRTNGVEPFVTLLDEFGRAVTDAGDGVELSGTEVQRGVAGQRDALTQAADLGWASA